ncbi:glycosyltransferase family 2 protein, partial [Roseovarius atlanticus]
MFFQRLYRVFLRYADSNLVLDQGGRPLHDAEDRPIGQVERLRLHQCRLIVEGRTTAARVGVERGTRCDWIRPAPPTFGAPLRDFVLDVPFEPGPLRVLAISNGNETSQAFDGFSPRRIALARLALIAPFAGALVRLSPQIWRWKRGGDMGARERVKEELGLVPRSYAGVLQADALNASGAAPCPFRSVTLVMPVHNAFGLLREALERVERHTDMAWRLVLVEDASTEPGLRAWAQDWAATAHRRDKVHLLCNETNLGFVRSVNRGFEKARRWPEDPVVLLNSDALVPKGWATRLLAPLANPAAATVTPLSNDAEIFTVPVMCRRHVLRPGMADALDAAAASLGQVAVAAPTGVGFCMALAPRFLADLPDFDTVFGRGYGEETDWCQKARARGGRHVCATDLFVEHCGGASFGTAEKQRLLESSSDEIARRYPHYDEEVQRFLRDDPLTTTRLALGLSWAALSQKGPVPVYLAHAIGGGSEKYLQDRIAGDVAAGGAAVVLRVGQRFRWKLELHAVHGVTSGVTEDVALLYRM